MKRCVTCGMSYPAAYGSTAWNYCSYDGTLLVDKEYKDKPMPPKYFWQMLGVALSIIEQAVSGAFFADEGQEFLDAWKERRLPKSIEAI